MTFAPFLIYTVASLPDPTTMPNNVLIVLDGSAADAAGTNNVVAGGGTTPLRVKSDGLVWRTYGRIRSTISSQIGPNPPTNLNLLTAPNNFGSAVWSSNLQNATVNNPGLASQQLRETVANGVHAIGQGVALIGPGALTFTIDAVNNLTRGWLEVILFNQDLSSYAGRYYIIATGAHGSIESAGTALTFESLNPVAIGSGYKVGIGAVIDATVTGVYAFIYLATADLTKSYAGNTANGMSLTNAQMYRVA